MTSEAPLFGNKSAKPLDVVGIRISGSAPRLLGKLDASAVGPVPPASRTVSLAPKVPLGAFDQASSCLPMLKQSLRDLRFPRRTLGTSLTQRQKGGGDQGDLPSD